MSKAFFRHIDKALQKAESGFKIMENPYLSCSWGKDSIVLIWLVRQLKPDIPVIFKDSGTSLPDIYQFRDKIVKEWNLNYAEIFRDKFHGMSYEDYLEAGKGKIEKDAIKDPLNEFAKAHHFDGNFWGLRAGESRGRAWLMKSRGYLFFSKTDQLWRCAPMAYWDNQLIWRIIDAYKIPYCPLYDNNRFFKRENLRSNGWASKRRLEEGRAVHLKYYYPKYFYKLLKIKPDLRQYV